MSKEFSQEEIKKAIEKEEIQKKANEEMERLFELPDEEFEKEKKKTLEELGIPEDRAEGFLKNPEKSREPKKD
ncbi:MAG: hypothetical protein A2V69_00395 [Candidatus Portnoybacteria bacterium RBG_13_40_8]|uniref:Uncharacterized protein n=1 Tax=Candidatus Portnoybacteria bacterium RBG_13_40_8 TaxID=1801990 RepID=A0A1G2F1B4_9BACT|nr:MAG: hypothetical protein A2V69_00395 [Candidatus Portnoybacteria bacterium RBG_13_40_8]OGZ36036.1 MAG: hypothetical protein A2V60_01835 [Candidatus Portnoybacteria bacterium RIFCSPHIGHO2_01_FULL_39_19]